MKISEAIPTLACLFALSFMAHAQTTAPTEWKTLDENWYIMEIGGARVGWTCSITESDGSRFRSIDRSQIQMNRGDVIVSIKSDSAFVETADGKPVSMEYTQDTSSQVMHTIWEFEGDHVMSIATQGGREVKKKNPAPSGQWLTPAAADRYGKKQMKAGEGEVVIRTLSPETGLQVITNTSRHAGAATLEVNGVKVPITVWQSSSDVMPGVVSTEKVDADGTLVYSEMASGMGSIVSRKATREQAMEAITGEGPDFFAKTFIKPDKKIDRSMHSTKARLKLVTKDGKMPVLPSAGAQRVEMDKDGKSAVLIIDINNNQPATAEEKEGRNFLGDSPMLDINDPLVQSLGKNGAKRAGKDQMAQAESLRKTVNKHISKKGMATAFASASETARTRTGDCSEHGVLLCALLRANGIPARVATGLVYVENFMDHQDIFGWHMWTQALIDGRWVDFDATLPRRYNAVHILTGTSSLNENFGAGDLSAIMQLVGNLDVQVLEVQYDDDRDSAGDGVHE
jgi:hypothetical protein